MNLKDATEAYLHYLEYRRGGTRTTLITYRSVLKQFVESIGNINIHTLRLSHIDAYADKLAGLNLKPKTYRNKLTIARSFVRYLYSKELSNIRPESIEVPPERPTESIYLTTGEKQLLLEAAKSNVRDYAMLHVLLSSGMRVTEFCNLKTTDLFRRSISIKNGKGRKHRVTFISHVAQSALDKYIELIRGDAFYLFPNPKGKPLSRVVIANKVRYYTKKAGINKHVTVHTLRHTFATEYLDSGGRIEDLQQILGHADLKTTMIYLHFSNERLHRSYDTIMAG